MEKYMEISAFLGIGDLYNMTHLSQSLFLCFVWETK